MLNRINGNNKNKNKRINSIKTKNKKLQNNKTKTDKNKSKYRNRQTNEKDNSESEASIYEKLRGKNAIWGGHETKAFKSWKKRTASDYKKQKGKIAYYRGIPTKNYRKYLEDLVKTKDKSKRIKKKGKNAKPIRKSKSEKRKSRMENVISVPITFEKITGKKAFWGGNETKIFMAWKEKIKRKFKIETGGKTHYRGKLTKSYKNYLKNLISS
jgi:hypothetical protein